VLDEPVSVNLGGSLRKLTLRPAFYLEHITPEAGLLVSQEACHCSTCPLQGAGALLCDSALLVSRDLDVSMGKCVNPTLGPVKSP
jgi:hypothetical protein